MPQVYHSGARVQVERSGVSTWTLRSSRCVGAIYFLPTTPMLYRIIYPIDRVEADNADDAKRYAEEMAHESLHLIRVEPARGSPSPELESLAGEIMNVLKLLK
jgi:hypothetical protein